MPDGQRLIEIKTFAQTPGILVQRPFGKQDKAQTMQVALPITLRDDLGVGTEVQFIEETADEGPQAKRVSIGKRPAAVTRLTR